VTTYVPSRTLPVRVELVRQLRRRRTQIVFGLVVALPVILWIAFTLAPAGPPSNSVSLVDLAKGSGGNFAVFALFASASFLLVVVVALFFGDTVAAEASWSSLRYLLAAPVPRSRLVRQKAIVAAMLSVAAILLLPIVALVVGALAYGTGDLVSPTGESLTFLQGAGRVLLGAVYLAIYLSWTAALALLLSVSTDAPLGAVGGAVLVSILSADPQPDHGAGGPARLPPDALRHGLVGPARDADQLGGHDPRRLLRPLLHGGVLGAGDLAVRPEGRHELMAGAKETRDGVELTSLDGPAFDGADATKRDLVDYLDAVADRIVPELEQRALSVVRMRPGSSRSCRRTCRSTRRTGSRAPRCGRTPRNATSPTRCATTGARCCGSPTSGPSSTTRACCGWASTTRSGSCWTSTRRRGPTSPPRWPPPASCARPWRVWGSRPR
jgi:ABC-2 type transport system permease protein